MALPENSAAAVFAGTRRASLASEAAHRVLESLGLWALHDMIMEAKQARDAINEQEFARRLFGMPLQ